MKRKPTLISLLVVAVLSLAGCGDSAEPTSADPGANPTTSPSAPSIPADTTPTAKFGETQQVTSEGFAVGSSEYTVSNPRIEGAQVVVDLAIDTTQGQTIPGVFAVLTDQGQKIENSDSSDPASFDGSGTMIAGEKRQGAVYFDVPPDSEVAKFVLYHGTVNPPKAYWVP